VSNELLPLSEVQSRILSLRGHRVLLDADLARFYGVPTFRFNEAVKRNAARFPHDFRFQITSEELTNLISQSAISSLGHGGLRKLPWAFTEHGALMAANILNSERAAKISVIVVRAFIALRRIALDHNVLEEKLAELDARVGGHDEQISEIVDALRKLLAPPGPEHDRKIGFHPGNR
jgi:hypothetical protein